MRFGSPKIGKNAVLTHFSDDFLELRYKCDFCGRVWLLSSSGQVSKGSASLRGLPQTHVAAIMPGRNGTGRRL